MELQKKKETLWSVKKKDSDGYFKLKFIEEGGVITGIGIGLSKSDNEIFFEMTPLEFKNFYSIIKSFKDLLYSEGLEFMVKPESEFMDKSETESEENSQDQTIKEIENLRRIERGVERKAGPLNLDPNAVKNIDTRDAKTNVTDIEDEKSNNEKNENTIEKSENYYHRTEELNKEIDVKTIFEDVDDITHTIDQTTKEIDTRDVITNITDIEDEKSNNERNEDTIKQPKQIYSQTEELDREFDTEKIFEDIDSITPTIEQGKTSEKFLTNDEDKIDEIDGMKKEKEKRKDKEVDLDPKKWDPW
ncbi:MAG: hypothetical protein ACTSWY_00400 [Promethearchaeota archaeon]